MTFPNAIQDFKNRSIYTSNKHFKMFSAGDVQNDRAATLGLALADENAPWKLEKENIRFIKIREVNYIRDLANQLDLINVRMADILNARGPVNTTTNLLEKCLAIEAQNKLAEDPPYS